MHCIPGDSPKFGDLVCRTSHKTIGLLTQISSMNLTKLHTKDSVHCPNFSFIENFIRTCIPPQTYRPRSHTEVKLISKTIYSRSNFQFKITFPLQQKFETARMIELFIFCRMVLAMESGVIASFLYTMRTQPFLRISNELLGIIKIHR